MFASAVSVVAYASFKDNLVELADTVAKEGVTELAVEDYKDLLGTHGFVSRPENPVNKSCC